MYYRRIINILWNKYVINEEDVTIMEVEKEINRQNQIQRFDVSEIQRSKTSRSISQIDYLFKGRFGIH